MIGFPYDANSSYLRGAAEAPRLIREAFACDSTNYWTESGIDLQDPSTIFNAGDCAFEKGFADSIEASVSAILERGMKPLSLGGDHSITFPIIRAMSRHHRELCILHFDAHPDIYHDFHGNPYSHASPVARIMEEKLAKGLVQVGIRTATGHQREQMKRFGVEAIEMKDFREDLRLEADAPLYISFDMDALDPSCAPGVSHPEPGGLTTRQAIGLIQRLKANVVGADIVEFNPRRDSGGLTAFVCAKLLKEIAAKMLA